MSALLKQFQESNDFQVVMDEVLKLRPVIPEYQPQATMDETANMIERIKYFSASRSGFDLLYRALAGRPPQ